MLMACPGLHHRNLLCTLSWVVALSAWYFEVEAFCDLKLQRELPPGSVVLPPLPTELREDVRQPRIINVTSYWHGHVHERLSQRKYYNHTSSWAWVPSLRKGFFNICKALTDWQQRVYVALQTDQLYGYGEAGILWLHLAGIVDGLEAAMLHAADEFPFSVGAAVRKWTLELVAYVRQLHGWAILKAEAMPDVWGTPRRLSWILAHLSDAATSTAMAGPGLVDSLLILHCVGSPRLGAWEFHTEMGPFRYDALSHLARRSGKKKPRVVEIGVNMGVTSTNVIATVPGVSFLGVDPYIAAPEEKIMQVRSAYSAAVEAAGGGSSATLARLTSAEGAASVDLWRSGWDEVDVVFIDTEKSYSSASRDIILWAPRAQPSGCVSGHDFCSFWMGTASAVLDLLPRGATLHFGPDHTWWWYVNERSERSVRDSEGNG
eukprot:TRINITY_DN50189_c0_g1_i1.p1 TRINITY_DN50189_c0_g1~~TRINITY_DN50189_c0_g1_i1.p1  ORF type:complete len:432 (-),score=45.04 TRINITY_DN50189_c0_g1_i1:28-1323(-)